MAFSILLSALTAQLEALQLAMNNTTGALNARGILLEDHLQDIPVCAREVANHGATVTRAVV